MAKKFGLNKGLGALLKDVADIAIAEPKRRSDSLDILDITGLKPGKYQPRHAIQEEELQNLAASIKSQGILQPIIVRLVKDSYEIIAGERRWRAAKLAGLKKVPVIIKSLNNEQALAIGLIENIQRENLNPLEEALALERLAKEFSLTHAEAAEMVGKSRSSVSNLLRLLALPKEVQLLIERKELDLGHAKVLLALNKSELQRTIAKQIVDQGLSVRDTEKLIEKSKTKENLGEISSSVKREDPDIKRLENSLSATLGGVVKIVHELSGKGKIIIKYNTLDELDGILAHIR